jgi:cystathionine beta-lyase
VLMQTPVYPPFLSGPATLDQQANPADLTRIQEGQRLRYEIDFDLFENAINPRTKVFLLCSPHNPVGRVWRKDELTRMAEICLEHDLVICSDEIHCDLLSEGHPHTPIAALSPEIAKRTVTVMAPSKTFNLPSLGFAFAIIQDEAMRQQYEAAAAILPHVGVMGYIGALAAYRDGQPWLDAVLAYLQANRDFTTQFVEDHMPEVAITHPEGTYLSWLDCRKYTGTNHEDAEVDEDDSGDWIDSFFLKNARVALNAGRIFGESGDGLAEGLQRMQNAMEQK